jgi:hypothetical protein
VVFPVKDTVAALEPLPRRRDILGQVLGCVARPLVTPEWMDATLALVEDLVATTRFFRLRFALDTDVAALLAPLVRCGPGEAG